MSPPIRFSLCEALILVLILGTVGSLALPLRQRMSEVTGLAKCRSNLHEVGAAVQLYAAEHQGRVLGNSPHGPITDDMQGTYIANGWMYGELVKPEFGGYGQRNYLGRVHPLICPSVAPEVYDNYSGHRRPEEITETNPILQTGYIWMFRPFGTAALTRLRANDTIHGNPHNPLLFDFGPILPGNLPYFPSHPTVINVLHLGGHVTSFPLEEARNHNNWYSLYDALRENSSSPASHE